MTAKTPTVPPAPDKAKQDRQARLSQALRENLRKRKAQARARKDGAKE